MDTTVRYVYALIDPRDGAVRYVGCTNNPEHRIADHICEARTKETNQGKKRWILSILADGLRPVMEVLQKTDDLSWEEDESRWIQVHRETGAELLNLTDGGCGSPGYDPPAIVREHMSAWHSSTNKTHCKHGHEFIPSNTYITTRPTNGRTRRHCMTCRRIVSAACSRKRRQRQK